MRELEAEARAQGADGVVGLRTEFTSVHMTKSATSVKLKLVNFVAVGTAMTRFAAASAMAPISALVLGDAPR
jgi:uncharacterized protein YbjQ (UPF0145 family)